MSNEDLSKWLDKLKDVEFELSEARERIEHQKRMIADIEKSKLNIKSVYVIQDNGIRYVMRITDVFETPDGVIVEDRI